MAKITKKDIDSLRRHLQEGKALLERLEAGELVESGSPTSTPQQKRKQFFSELLESGRRVKKSEIQGL